MTQTIKGDLILTEDTIIKSNLVVEGDIRGYFDLKVAGNINAKNIYAKNIYAGNIDAGNIYAWNINAKNIYAGNIDALNINAGNIDALNINAKNIYAGNIDAGNINAKNIYAWNIVLCDKIKVKEGCKVICKFLITDRFSIERKEWKI